MSLNEAASDWAGAISDDKNSTFAVHHNKRFIWVSQMSALLEFFDLLSTILSHAI